MNDTPNKLMSGLIMCGKMFLASAVEERGKDSGQGLNLLFTQAERSVVLSSICSHD